MEDDQERKLRQFVFEICRVARKFGFGFEKRDLSEADGTHYPGTFADQLFFSFSAYLTQHTDPGEPFPTVGLWGDLKQDVEKEIGCVEGGYFVFSQRNLIVPFNPKGSILIWQACTEEHGTSVLKANGNVQRFGSAVTHKAKLTNLINKQPH